MISVKEAKKILSDNLERGAMTNCSLQESLGRILAVSVVSPIDVPSFDNSAMDGYAMAFDGKENEWQVISKVQAGDTSVAPLNPWQAARIFTGAKIPEGADTVIPQELVELDKAANIVCYSGENIRKGSNVRIKGAQCREGDLLVNTGTLITPAVIGLLASVGIGEVQVFDTPSVACIITGNELKEVGQELKEGEIYNSNGPMLEACLRQLGISKTVVLRAVDDKSKLQRLINGALDKHEVLILSGGISVGDYDFVKECLEKAGVEQLFYKVKQRPGKPFYAGSKDGKYVFALPGNPASVFSCFHQFVRPSLKYMMGHGQVWEPDAVLELTEEVKKKAGFSFFMKARREDGKVRVLGGQQSFNLLAFNEADALVELEEDAELIKKGTPVKVYFL